MKVSKRSKGLVHYNKKVKFKAPSRLKKRNNFRVDMTIPKPKWKAINKIPTFYINQK